MSDFVNVCIPGGESYIDLYDRVVEFFEQNINHAEPTAIVAHGGVLRSLLSYINKIELKESFEAFSLRYGCVVKLNLNNNRLQHAILHNPEAEKEQHRPAFY
jgi:alpha-ribazole phosphatase